MEEYCLWNNGNVSDGGTLHSTLYLNSPEHIEHPPEFAFGILEALGHKVHRLIRLVLVWLDCCLSWVEWFVLGLVRKGVLEKDTIHYPDVYERSVEA